MIPKIFLFIATVACFALFIFNAEKPQLQSSPGFNKISGTVHFNDGDSLEVLGLKIRLYGIDAPEFNQTCSDQKNIEFNCGQQALNWLRNLFAGSYVDCFPKAKDRYGRFVAVCSLPSEGISDLSEYIAQNGWAVAYRQFTSDYVAAEQKAKSNKLGIWDSTFMLPHDFRRSLREKSL